MRFHALSWHAGLWLGTNDSLEPADLTNISHSFATNVIRKTYLTAVNNMSWLYRLSQVRSISNLSVWSVSLYHSIAVTAVTGKTLYTMLFFLYKAWKFFWLNDRHKFLISIFPMSDFSQSYTWINAVDLKTTRMVVAKLLLLTDPEWSLCGFSLTVINTSRCLTPRNVILQWTILIANHQSNIVKSGMKIIYPVT